MNEAEKQEIANIARREVVAAIKELTPVFEASVARLTATVEKMVTRLEEVVVRGNEQTGYIEGLINAQSRTMKFTQGLADEYGSIFNALSARIGALETGKEPPPAPRAN